MARRSNIAFSVRVGYIAVSWVWVAGVNPTLKGWGCKKESVGGWPAGDSGVLRTHGNYLCVLFLFFVFVFVFWGFLVLVFWFGFGFCLVCFVPVIINTIIRLFVPHQKNKKQGETKQTDRNVTSKWKWLARTKLVISSLKHVAASAHSSEAMRDPPDPTPLEAALREEALCIWCVFDD